jgi:ketosteroid isomerase-like protein
VIVHSWPLAYRMSEPLLTAQDENDIRRVIASYARAVDRCDAELMLAVYHPDAIDDHGSFQLPAAEAVDRIMMAVHRTKSCQHNMTHTLIEGVDADTAHVETYAVCYLVEDDVDTGGDQLRSLGLRYVDRFERRGHWAIANRRVVHDWSTISPITKTWPTAPKLPQGARDRTDPVYTRAPAAQGA